MVLKLTMMQDAIPTFTSVYLKNNEVSDYRYVTNLAPSWLLVLSMVIVL